MSRLVLGMEEMDGQKRSVIEAPEREKSCSDGGGVEYWLC